MTDDKFLIESGDKMNYEPKGWFVEASLLDIFPLEFVHGNPATSLRAPKTMIISQDMAERYFGKEDPVGKILKLDKSDIEINGVFKNLPGHFHLDFNYLVSLATAELPEDRMQSWGWHQFFTYVKLKPGTDVNLLQEKFQEHIKKEILPNEPQRGLSWLPYFQALKNIHLQSAEFTYDNAVKGNETYVKALTIIALFVLVIACFNFINLATARSFKRAREIGIRKVVGAYKKQLVTQFIGESVILAVLSMIVAMIATMLIIPWLNQFTGKSIEFNPFTNPLPGLSLLCASVIIGILAGIYPALVLSGFKPVKVLKSMKVADTDLSSAVLRKSLIVVQFALSVLLIICTVIVYRQTKFFNDKDLGFDKEQILEFQARGKVAGNLQTFITELKRSPNVVSVTSGYGLPGDKYAGDGVTIPGENGDQERSAVVLVGDHDYVKTLGLRIIAGRDFSREMSTDVNEAFIINETAVREFGFGTPLEAIGRRLNWKEWEPADSLKPIKQGRVIGVVQDFHYKSLHEKISPAVIQIYPQVLYKVAAKLQTRDIRSTISFIEGVWNKFAPEYPFDYEFMDESYGKMYRSEEKLGTLLWIFAVMAIVVGCLGLFALAALSAEEKTKEIGIRKAVGAKAMQIMTLLSGNILSLVIIAAVIAIPVAWLTMTNWLEKFSYRTTIEWWIFLLSVLLIAAIALFTISFQTIRVSLMKPVKALRTE
jgi:putative ABC transport system permease protein